MTGTKTCRRCGEPIAPGALGGNCPRCLVALAISTVSGEQQTASSKSIRPDEFFGDYRIEGELARGGMGVVFRARQVSLNRPVALKMIAGGQLATAAQVQRFRMEAEAAARLDHPNIVPIYEVGEHQAQHFYSMKLVEGGDLAQQTADGKWKREDARRVAELVAKIARAVHYAHQRGVLHRDLKPTNILIDDRGEPHITDFGLAKLFEEDTTLTQSVAVLGTPAYMAPELASGKAAQATTAADVYSLGAILYELLTGHPPFVAENVPALLRKIVEEEPRPAAVRVDRDLEIICLKCLEKEPLSRYTSARALAEDLERWLAGEPIVARSAGATEKLWRWCKRKPALAALWSALVLVFVTGIMGVFWQWRRAEAHATNAQQAASRARDELWRSQLAQARAHRLSGVAGRKEESLAAVKSAAAIRPSPELRDEAIAALALTDVSETGLWQPARILDFEDHAFAPELDRYALGRVGGEVSVFRMDTGQKIAQFQGPPNVARKVQFSPNGRLLAARFDNGEVTVWNLATGASVLREDSGEGYRGGRSFDFSPDSTMLAVANGTDGVRLYSLVHSSEAERLSLEGDSGMPRFSPDGRVLAVGTASNIVLWSLTERRLTRVLPHPAEVSSFAWHPDGNRLASTSARNLEVWLWDTTATNLLTLKGHSELVHLVTFNRRGDVLMSAAYDGSTRFWNAGTGEALFISRAGFGREFSSDDARIGYTRESQGLGVWKVNASAIYRRINLPLGPRIAGFDFSPDGRFLIVVNAQGLHLCDPGTGAHLASASHRNNHSVWFAPDGKRVVLVGADHLHSWGLLQNGSQLQLQDKGRFDYQPRAPLDAGSVTRGLRHLLTVPSVDQVLCVDLGEPGAGWILPGKGLIGIINSAAISPDTNWIATSYWKDGGTFVWDTRTRERVHGFGAAGGFVTFSPDSRQLLVGSARGYAMWEIGTWRRLWELARRSPSELVGRGAFSPDGRMIALCPEVNLLQLVEAESGKKIATLDAPMPKNIGQVAFGPDGSLLAVSTFDNEIQLWDLRALRQELAKLKLDWQ